jgi:hypothetical protein
MSREHVQRESVITHIFKCSYTGKGQSWHAECVQSLKSHSVHNLPWISHQFDNLNHILWGVQSCNSSLCSLLHFPITLSLLCPKIFLNTLFLDNLGLYFSLSVRDQVACSYKTTGKILVLCKCIGKLAVMHLLFVLFPFKWVCKFTLLTFFVLQLLHKLLTFSQDLC